MPAWWFPALPQPPIVYATGVSVNEIKRAIEHLSTEERLELMQWLNQSADDEWDLQMKRDGAAGKFDKLIKESEAEYREGRTSKLERAMKVR